MKKFFSMVGKITLLILECIWYLICAISFIWLLLDVFDSKRGK